MRVCVDMRKANTAIKTEKNVCPTVDDIILTLNGATVFSRLDLYKAFHQIELDEASRVMTTFQTHIGLFRYKRLNFGVSAAPIIFQNELRQALQGLKGILNIADDIVCFGKTHEEHDANLRALLQRLQDRNLTLNSQKCSFGQSKIKFYGYVFSESGISPDPDKVNAVKNMDRPKSISEIRSFLGLTNYLSKFIDGYSSLTEPLRRLTHKGVKFEWTADQEKSFTSLKDTLISDKVMTYFDPRKETELWVDGSPVGCSGILIQNGKIVSYGSKAYNSVQTRYSQTEREALSAVIMIQHFHLYLFGKKFKLITDHAALQSIFNNIKTIQSPRLERWRLKLTTYDFQTVYRPGKMMISDYLSRHPHARHETNTVAEQYISFITDNALPDALKLSDVAKATETDCILSCVRNALEQNDWKTQKCKLDENFRLYENLNKNQELAVAYTEDGFVLLRGTKLCIPECLQKQTVMLSHEGHQGQSKCKGLLREYCWFPHMDRMVEEICRSCIVCQAASTRIIPDPIKPTLLPRDVFSEVSCDFCGPFPDGYMLLVVICDYSRFPVVERIKSTAADTVIPRLEAIFSIFGYPEVVKTDNGPPFQSRAFREFADNSGFKHKRITPLHPQANGIVERFMAPLQKAIKTAIASRQDYKRALSRYLMNFRNTPQTTTQTAPSELMFNRKLKTKLPKMTFDNKDTDIRDRDSLSKTKNKIYADKKRRAQPNNLKLGDRVLLKREQRNKFETAFDPTPGIIIAMKGSMLTIKHKGKEITRDVSKFRYVHGDQEPVQTKPADNTSLPRNRPQRKRRPPRRYED